MKIGVLSGKGGTGKTTIATNLAYVLQPSVMVDSDVEEPNLHLFFQRNKIADRFVKKIYPSVDTMTCLKCGACGNFCKFNAIIPAKKGVLIYKEMCHGCGGCALVCPSNSITYREREIGKIVEEKILKDTGLFSGVLNVGELSGVEIIKSLNQLNSEDIVLIDSPPGTSCTTAEAIKTIDYAILVTEPTVFGMSDLLMIMELLNSREIPYGVVINKSGIGDDALSLYLGINKIQLLGEIPFDKRYAQAYSKGKILSELYPDYYKMMEDIIEHLPFTSEEMKGDYHNE